MTTLSLSEFLIYSLLALIIFAILVRGDMVKKGLSLKQALWKNDVFLFSVSTFFVLQLTTAKQPTYIVLLVIAVLTDRYRRSLPDNK